MAGRPTIAACLIIRDEERFLEGCLASIVDHVDEIVVVDTGSTDNSMEIARRYGVRLIEKAWSNDFAIARNTGLDAATTDGILYIDADERLSLPEGCALTDELAEPDVFAARVRFFVMLNVTACLEYRLFRNDPRLRFHGAMHETILPALHRLQEGVGARVVESPATITHLGYEGDLTHKFRRNLPLLRTAVAREPERLYYWYDLARSLLGLGEYAEAAQVASEAVARAKASTRALDHTVGSGAADILTRILKAQGKDVLQAAEAGLALKPDHPRLLFVKARVLVDRGELEAACAILEEICARDVGGFVDESMPYDMRIFTQMAPHLLGTTLLRLGRVAQAAQAFARVSASMPEDGDYARNAALLESSRSG